MAGAKAKAIDFSDVKDRGEFNPKRVAEGDYAAKITKVVDDTSKAGNFQYVFTIKLNKFSQHSYPYYCGVEQKTLWKLRNVAVAAGMNVPKKRMKFDPNKLVGKTIGVTIVDSEPYEGRIKSEIDAVFPVSELEDGGVDEGTSDDDGSFDEDSAPQLAGGDDDDTAEDEAAEPEEKPKKKKKGKKGKKKKGTDEENLEELDISDL